MPRQIILTTETTGTTGTLELPRFIATPSKGFGYRVYFVQRGPMLIILLAGGDKRTQKRDIKKALELARTF
jgi:putative addiction module killer protein